MLTNLIRAKKIHLLTLVTLILLMFAITPQAAWAASHANTVYVPFAGTDEPDAIAAASEPGAVYVLTNQTGGNAVAVFNRSADGTLSAAGTVATGGLGTGAGLGSQGAIILSDNGQWLFAVNAGSNEISVFAVQPSGLNLTDKVPSGGVRPTSLTFYKGLLYVLNAGDPGNIMGFTLNNEGHLTPISGSTRSLSSTTAAAAQISFTPDGQMLVVTERATKTIDTYTVDKDGLATGPTAHPSSGDTPFGFAFAGKTLVVSEAFGGMPNASAVSSYQINASEFNVVSASSPTGETAACWVAATKNGKYAYSANAGSASVSAFSVGQDGSLTLIAGQAGMTGDGPIDMDTSHNSQYLYVLNGRGQSISAFAIQADGSLVSLGNFGHPLVMGSAGIAAW
jgi:6-phosphogluconolactonase